MATERYYIADIHLLYNKKQINSRKEVYCISKYKVRKFVLVVLAMLIVVSCTGLPVFAENVIVPRLSTDMKGYIQYDANIFELLDNNVESAVVDGYIQFGTNALRKE